MVTRDLVRVLALAALVACHPAVRRDLSRVPAGTVGFDDMCGLQTYFDAIAAGKAAPPDLINATDLEGGKAQPRPGEAPAPSRGGRARFAFQTDFQLQTVRRILTENWKRLPDKVSTARRIDLEVQWSSKAGVRRVVTEVDADLLIGGATWKLPYHVCLSELLFGEPLYRQRRESGAGAPRAGETAPMQ